MSTATQTKFAATIERIVDATGQGEAFRTSDHFHIKVTNGAYMPLVIESWPSPQYPGRRNVSVAHYFEQAGDLVADPEVEMVDTGMPIGLTQVFGYTRCLWEQDGKLMIAPRAKADVMSFLTTWGRNLVAQRFVEAAKKMAPLVWTAEMAAQREAEYRAFCD